MPKFRLIKKNIGAVLFMAHNRKPRTVPPLCKDNKIESIRNKLLGINLEKH